MGDRIAQRGARRNRQVFRSDIAVRDLTTDLFFYYSRNNE